ncbi:GNAT family N-acetyltransferase [Viridibacillus soli]|uniref:GNAT family N-acetyltransferase n=1 Tax=Viridibacillus soli TaxID=2798301 RepID=UPI001F2E5895|nr:GNAT family N-acetyltransferase [Viridibacillus soli]
MEYQVGKGNFWISTVNDKVIGTISLYDIGNNQLALKKMFVAKQFRGQGYRTAQLLLETAISWAKYHNAIEIFLGTTPQFLAAHRFYEKNGFMEITASELPPAFPLLEVDKKFYRYGL